MTTRKEPQRWRQKPSARPKTLPLPTDIHTQPEAKDSAVSHFQVLMFHQTRKKSLTHRGKVRYKKKSKLSTAQESSETQRKKKVISHSPDTDHSSDGKRTKGKTRRTQTFKFNWSTSSGAAYFQQTQAFTDTGHRCRSRHEAQLFIHRKDQPLKYLGNNLYSLGKLRQGTDIMRQTKLQSFDWEKMTVCSRKACQAGWYGFCRLYCYFIQIFPARSPGSGDWALLLQHILIRFSCTLKSGFLRITSYSCGKWPVYAWRKQGERPRAGSLNISVGGERGMFWAQTATNAARLCLVWCLTIKKKR